MKQTLVILLLVILLLLALGCASGGSAPPAEGRTAAGTLQNLTPEARLAYLREASVWSPIDTAALDLRAGPPGASVAPGSTFDCDFVLPPEAPSGYSPKFLCRAADGKTYKVKYGRENLEVYGEVIGSRLLWALGFHSDRIDPVKVRCRGCPDDPWKYTKHSSSDAPPADQVREFEPAILESYYGTIMESNPEQGASWDEIFDEMTRDPKRLPEQHVHREALALFAAFLQHADSKPSQQTLTCPKGAVTRDTSGNESCSAPEMYIGDIGAILGDGWKYKRISTTKVDYPRWKATEVWLEPDDCVAVVHGRPNATLHDVTVSEPAREFLAARLGLLSHAQLRDVFDLARVDLLATPLETPDGTRTVTADDWATLFLEKATRIRDHRCPEGEGFLSGE